MPSHFFLKLVPCRPTFAQDMTDSERAIMQQHAGYLTARMNEGKVIVFGPVMDPGGAYGMAIVATESEEEAREITASDPASTIHHYEICPMRAVLPS
jgi:uncharacterized protein YciI